MRQFTSRHGPGTSRLRPPAPDPIAALLAEDAAGAPPPSLSPPNSRTSRTTRVDWQRIAALMAEGHPVAEVARQANCSRQHVWRVVRRQRAAAARAADPDAARAEAEARLAELRPLVVDGLARQAEAGNPRVLLWLAERLRVGRDLAEAAPPPADAAPDSLSHEEWLDVLDALDFRDRARAGISPG